ncbi:YtxH domain-containing protein [Petrachloros mirabilis]
MSERTDGVLMGGFMFLAGLAVGVGAGLLIAPESGARTRKRLRNYAEDLGDQITDFADDTKVKVGKMVDRGKEFVSTNHA